MKILKLGISVALFIIIYLIYIFTVNNKYIYVSLGDFLTKSINSYNTNAYGYNDIIDNYLKENRLLKKSYIIKEYNNGSGLEIYNSLANKIEATNDLKKVKEYLTKADIVVVSMSHQEIFNQASISKNGVIEEIKNVELALNDVRKYAKKQLYIINYYYPDTTNIDAMENINVANAALNKLAIKYNLIIIDASDILSNKAMFNNPKNIYPNNKGYQLLGEQVLKSIQSNM